MSEKGLVLNSLLWSFPGSEKPFIDIPFLEIERGSATSLVGPSGAGKSTLLFLLAGLDASIKGEIRWNGDAITAMSGKQKERWRREKLGLVFQDFRLVGELSALENVLLPETFSHWRVPREKRRRGIELLERLNIKRTGARASSLSRGEMQRVAIARAMIEKPEILLCDEPTASLDAENEEEVARMLVELARENHSTLIVATHQKLFRELSDQIISIEHGKIV